MQSTEKLSAWQNSATIVSIPSSFWISLIAVLISVYLFWKRSNKRVVNNVKRHNEVERKPEKWVKVGVVKKLIVYPVKSCSGTVIDKGVLSTLGLKCEHTNIRDRDFMIVDENGKLVCLMEYPQLAFVTTAINENDIVTVTAPEMPPLAFTFPQADDEQNEKSCRVEHDKNLKALDCGDKVAQWFCEYLQNSGLRVYYHHLRVTQRTSQPYMNKCPQFQQSDMGTFHSKTSYLMISEESIQDLNKRVDKNSSWKNWRPTILIDQVSEPFAEVNWSFVRIGNGNGILKASFPCKRCSITTVDYDLGIMPKDGEPLRTLRSMNVGEQLSGKQMQELFSNKGLMGLCLGLYLPAGEGAIISTGDPVYTALL